MTNYQKGVIYSIRCHSKPELVYIGSTTQPLYKRFFKHKESYGYFIEGKAKYVSAYEIIMYDDCYIEEIEKYPCNDRQELRRREGQIIREMECVNKVIAGRTKKEYQEDNKEKINQQRKEFRQKNRERIRQDKKKYYDDNKESILDYHKKYREENKEIIREKIKKRYERNKDKISYRGKTEKYTCECGSYLRKSDKSRHERTMKHKRLLEQSRANSSSRMMLNS